MARNSRSSALTAPLARFSDRYGKDPRVLVRAALGLLLAANLAAAVFVFRPWGGSPEELQRRLSGLRTEVRQRTETTQRLSTLVATVEKTHIEASGFMAKYFLDSRTAYSTVLTELGELAKEAGIKQKEHSFIAEPIEGSDTLSMMAITGYYEGTYADLVQFVNRLDRSERFITIESLQATPQQSQGILNVVLKLNVLVRGGGEAI